MQSKVGQFLHLIAMASQAEAMQGHLAGMSHEVKLRWLAVHGLLDLVPTPSCRGPDAYRLTSHMDFSAYSSPALIGSS